MYVSAFRCLYTYTPVPALERKEEGGCGGFHLFACLSVF